MGDAGVGWIAAIIIGGIAGWLAEKFMKSNMGLIMNIVLGIVGAAIASAILSYFGIVLGGWIGYLISGFIGAVLLIWKSGRYGQLEDIKAAATAYADTGDPVPRPQDAGLALGRQSDRCQSCESIGRSFNRSATKRRRKPVSGSSR